MIYFSFLDFFEACTAFFLLGVIFALISSMLRIFPKLLGYIIKCIAVSLSGKLTTLNRFRPNVGCVNKSNKSENANKYSFVYDFLFTLLFGTSFIIFSYVFLDGYIRLFCVVISVISYFFFKERIEKLGAFLVFCFSFFVFGFSKILALISFFLRNLIKFVFLPVLYIFRQILQAVFALKHLIFTINAIDKTKKK